MHNSSLMRKQSGFKKLVKWKWYEIRNFINKFGWNSIFKKIFSITSGLNGLLILIGDKVRYKKGSKKLKPKGMVLVKGRNQGFSNPYFLKIWSTKTERKKVKMDFLGLMIIIWYLFFKISPKLLLEFKFLRYLKFFVPW